MLHIYLRNVYIYVLTVFFNQHHHETQKHHNITLHNEWLTFKDTRIQEKLRGASRWLRGSRECASPAPPRPAPPLPPHSHLLSLLATTAAVALSQPNFANEHLRRLKKINVTSTFPAMEVLDNGRLWFDKA